MGYKCCVFGCNSNYQHLRKDKRETLVNVTVFSFPKSESLRKEWIKHTKPGSGNYLELSLNCSSLHRNTPAKAFINMGPKHAQLLNWKGTSTFYISYYKVVGYAKH